MLYCFIYTKYKYIKSEFFPLMIIYCHMLFMVVTIQFHEREDMIFVNTVFLRRQRDLELKKNLTSIY